METSCAHAKSERRFTDSAFITTARKHRPTAFVVAVKVRVNIASQSRRLGPTRLHGEDELGVGNVTNGLADNHINTSIIDLHDSSLESSESGFTVWPDVGKNLCHRNYLSALVTNAQGT